jgi:hypothetical protein
MRTAPRPGGVQRRPKVIAHEIALFLGAVQAGVPALARLGLVLHRYAPDRHALGRIGLDETHEALCPGGAALRPEASAVVHAAAVLHPGRRAPGRGQQLEFAAAGLRHALGGLDHRQQRLAVALDAEALERVVVRLFDMRVVAQREVAAVHVHAAQAVAVTLGGIEIGVQQGLALPGDSFNQVLAAASVKAPPKPSRVWKRRERSTQSRAGARACAAGSGSGRSGACGLSRSSCPWRASRALSTQGRAAAGRDINVPNAVRRCAAAAGR